MPSGNEIPIVHLEDDWGQVARAAKRLQVDWDGARRTKSKHSTTSMRGLREGPG